MIPNLNGKENISKIVAEVGAIEKINRENSMKPKLPARLIKINQLQDSLTKIRKLCSRFCSLDDQRSYVRSYYFTEMDKIS